MHDAITSFAHPRKGAVLLGALLAGLLALYIFQVNALTAQVYLLGDQEKRLESLKEKSVLLEATRLPSFTRARMEELAERLRFERVREVSYLKVLGGSVARNGGQE
ncbi:MAG: hypothetical protein Q8P12_04035 [bacterium]|nr:hypothetical protein [bacterium]